MQSFNRYVVPLFMGLLILSSCNQQQQKTEPTGKGNSKWNGEAKLDVRESTPDWKPFIRKTAPAGSPNILIILYDDTGLGAWSPYGGRINMPTLDKLAADGLT